MIHHIWICLLQRGRGVEKGGGKSRFHKFIVRSGETGRRFDVLVQTSTLQRPKRMGWQNLHWKAIILGEERRRAIKKEDWRGNVKILYRRTAVRAWWRNLWFPAGPPATIARALDVHAAGNAAGAAAAAAHPLRTNVCNLPNISLFFSFLKYYIYDFFAEIA